MARIQDTYEYAGVLTVIDCANCGLVFGITEDFEQRRRKDHQGFTCPNGHSNVYNDASEAEKLRKEKAVLQRQLDEAYSREEQQRTRAAAAERTSAALKGHLTRYRKRVANGVCPVAGCHRHFPNVQAHVETVHGDWLADHPEMFEGS